VSDSSSEGCSTGVAKSAVSSPTSLACLSKADSGYLPMISATSPSRASVAASTSSSKSLS